jgi:hypothetical protein
MMNFFQVIKLKAYQHGSDVKDVFEGKRNDKKGMGWFAKSFCKKIL